MNDDKNREFAELMKRCWHKWDTPTLQGQMFTCELCGEWSEKPYHPDYAADPRLVLREMKRIGKLEEFLRNKIYPLGSTGYNIPIDYLVDSNGELETTGKLRDVAIQFMRKESEDNSRSSREISFAEWKKNGNYY